jgi:hypothetical protein
MDMKLDPQKRDFYTTIQGFPVELEGAEEQAQRIWLRLAIPRGSFRLNPELGSDLYRMPRGSREQMEEFARKAIQDALAPISGVRLQQVSCSYSQEEDRARVECSLALGGRALELALEV